MDLNLPQKCIVSKPIPKTKFYERVSITKKLQGEFVSQIQKITWKYKLAEETLGISKTADIIEIQIFEIELKQQLIPKNILKIIEKTIPYNILYHFKYKNSFAFGVTLKAKDSKKNYYFSEWDKKLEFDFSGIDLEKVYQKIIKAFIKDEIKKDADFEEIIDIDLRIKAFENEIKKTESKLRKEMQFNRKVEINKRLLDLLKQLEELNG